MSWNIYYKYVANAPENETQFPRGEHPGPCLFLPPSVVVSNFGSLDKVLNGLEDFLN